MGTKKSKKNFEKIYIGNTLRSIRRSLGMTQETVSEAIELAPRYISDIERNKSKGSIDTLVKLCNLYQVTPTFVLQNYLTTPSTKDDNFSSEFSKLSPEEKEFIITLINFLNQSRRKDSKKKKRS